MGGFWDRFIKEHPVGLLSVDDLCTALKDWGFADRVSSELLYPIQVAVLKTEISERVPHTEVRRQIQLALKALTRARERLEKCCDPDGVWLSDGTPRWISFAAISLGGGEGRPLGGIAPAIPPECDRLTALIGEVAWASEFLTQVDEFIPAQAPRWRGPRRRFVMFARELSPIYQELTGERPTVNNWPERKSYGPWAEFYLSIAKLTLGVASVPDLRGVLDEARKNPSR